jgi:endothelin-converting enzyme/putative endopeptidase
MTKRTLILPAAALFALTTTLPALGQETPFAQLPYTPSLDVSAMDRTADPCEDLYQYSCGGWMKNNPLPGDQASWSVYGKLSEDNQRYLWGLLAAAAKPGAQRSATEQKIGDYFDACMDVDAVEATGASPLTADLDRIAAIESVNDLGGYLGSIHSRAATSSMLFGTGVEQDARDSSIQIMALYAGGLGLPDRDYYLKDDARSKELRAQYVRHIGNMLILMGDTPQPAKDGAAAVMRIETALANASLNVVDRRDPYKVYHRTTPASLRTLVPSIDWDDYFAALDGKPGEWLNVSEPKAFEQVEALLKTESLADIKTYLRWTLVSNRADYLSRAFVDEHFAFYRATLRGVKEQQPRWKKCVSWVDRDLGEALGKEFVDREFPPENKAKAIAMTNLVVAAMATRIQDLDWMSDETKKQALDKLGKVRNKVGFPDVWRDYTALEIKRGDLYGNVSRSTVFETQRQLARIGKPVDRDEWFMTPPTVNAYYNPSMNDINFPAGVLMPPLYDVKIDDAPNYGNTGGTIGHELTHGFDDSGRQFDGDGNLRDWWTAKDAEEFEKRADCVRDQYSGYVVVDDIRINGKLTAGEDIADLGGTILAWAAWKEATKGMQLEPIEGLTPDQRFFVGLAQWACENQRPENLRVSAATNPHSPNRYRVNGLVVNMPEFAKAFHCKGGAALKKAPGKVCKVW